MKSDGYINYLKNVKKEKRSILISQILLFLSILFIWEIFSTYGFIDSFLFSKPSDIFKLFFDYLQNGELLKHIYVSVYETLVGLFVGTFLGIIIAIFLWYFDRASKILDPFLVVLNALPKTALAPIIIVWAGAGVSGIIVIAITISLVMTILSSYNYFINVDSDKIKMLKSFNASKLQILFKLILPSNIKNLINLTKINIGMAWVGVIVGEFLVSRYGIGYLIVYGGQVFKLDLVMMGVFVLAFCAWIMYFILNFIENLYNKKR